MKLFRRFRKKNEIISPSPEDLIINELEPEDIRETDAINLHVVFEKSTIFITCDQVDLEDNKLLVNGIYKKFDDTDLRIFQSNRWLTFNMGKIKYYETFPRTVSYITIKTLKRVEEKLFGNEGRYIPL